MLFAQSRSGQKMCAKIGIAAAFAAAAVISIVSPQESAPTIMASCHTSEGSDTFNMSCGPEALSSDIFNEQNEVDATIPGQSATHGGSSGGGSGATATHATGGNAISTTTHVSAPKTGGDHAGFAQVGVHAGGHR